MQKSQINPTILQAMLDSAFNAADKGQSQFFSPVPFGQALAAALPPTRPYLVDLTCGAGHLLQASATRETVAVCGSDIDPCHGKTVSPDTALVHRLTASLPAVYPLLVEVDWTADAFVLNPPWRLFWHRDQLAALGQSKLAAVRDAFAAHEDINAGGCPKEGIDSTIATLMMALDRCSLYGEGLLIANDSTLQRLLFQERAPFSALAKHAWLHLTIPGNPMTGIEHCQWQEEQQFHTGVLYFARDHTVGPKHETLTLEELLARPTMLSRFRVYRQGAELRNANLAHEPVSLWLAVKDRLAELAGKEPKVPWNLWLTAGGRIRTALSRFQEHSTKVDKREAARLNALNGKAPMELVLQRAQRDELLHVAEKAGWRVQPELLDAVRQAIQAYHAARAPLYPLPQIQRLGYLDEQDAIDCTRDLGPFQAGHSYPLRTQTVPVTRSSQKPNSFTGDMEQLEFHGQELALFIRTGDVEEDGKEFCFMDAKLKNDASTKVPNAKQHKRRTSFNDAGPDPNDPPIDFTLQDLCEHFVIPPVLDVASVSPIEYANNLATLDRLELLVA